MRSDADSVMGAVWLLKSIAGFESPGKQLVVVFNNYNRHMPFHGTPLHSHPRCPVVVSAPTVHFVCSSQARWVNGKLCKRWKASRSSEIQRIRAFASR